MTRFGVFFVLFLIATVASGQKPPIKFGDVPIEQLKMTVYDKDSSAAAVVLADYGESTIDYANNAFLIRFVRTRRVKIFNKDGLEWGNMTIPLYRSRGVDEDLSSVKAVTYNLEGTKVVETKMKSDGIFKESADQNLMYAKLVLPNVREGSVVEITYTINSPFIYNFQDWDFQTTIPTVWSEYRTRIPEYFTYKKFVQGYLPVSVNENKPEFKAFNINTRVQSGTSAARTEAVQERVEYTENYNRLVIKDAPAFKSEPYMTTYRNYISSINFELSMVKIPGQDIKTYNDSWEDLNRDFLKADNFGGVIRGSGFLKEEVDKLVAGKSDAREKIGTIYSWVKSNVEWDGQYRKYSDGNLKQVLNNKKGSSAEINLMLVSMLQKGGFAASPVLISTRDHGFIRRETSAETQFNYVIALVQVEDKQVLLDATDRSLAMNVLPLRCINGEGFIISPDKPGWIGVSSSKARTTATSEFTLSQEGKLSGKVNFSHDSYFGQKVRKQYFSKGKEDYLKDVASTYQWEVSSGEFENMEKLSESVKENYQVQLNEHIQHTGDKMYINPILVHRIDKNPFQSENRQYPVDYGSPEDRLFMAKVTIPDGWTVEELPQAKALVLPANSGRYVYSISQTGNVVSVTSQLVINKALFSHEEYVPLRDFYAQVVAKQAEQIVLKKN